MPASETIAATLPDGFAIVPDVIDSEMARNLIAAIEAAQQDSSSSSIATPGLRNLLQAVPAIRQLANAPALASLLNPILGPAYRVVRGLMFDKTPEANWKVAWHQDLSIAVKRRIDIPGFGPWSMKAGVQHVQPPVEILQQMLTIRLHLDDCDADNGPLRVLPGSHADGVLSPAKVEAWRESGATVECHVSAGGVLLMRPLLLHASSPAKQPRHRRVIHLEYAACDLPGGLEWSESVTQTPHPPRDALFGR